MDGTASRMRDGSWRSGRDVLIEPGRQLRVTRVTLCSLITLPTVCWPCTSSSVAILVSRKRVHFFNCAHISRSLIDDPRNIRIPSRALDNRFPYHT